MTAYEFDPKSVYAAQEDLLKALVHMSDVVERPLRRVDLPEMPAAVRGQVQSGVAEAISLMSTARSSIAGVATEMKQKTYDLVPHKKISAELGWGWKLGDAVIIKGSAFTGTDIIHKAINYKEYGWKGVAGSAVSFGTNFVPVGKIFGAASKGGKAALGTIRGTRAANTARVAAQMERVAGAQGMKVVRAPRPGGGLGAARPILKRTSAADDAARGTGGVQNLAPRPGAPNPAAGGLLDKAEGIAGGGKFQLKPNSTNLYSGGAHDVALGVAAKTGGTVIDFTKPGMFLESLKLFDILPAPLALRVWGNLSENFVKQSVGPLRATVGDTVVASSVFATREIPAMLLNTKVPYLTVRHAGQGVATARPIQISRSDPRAMETMIQEINRGGWVRFTFVS
jgi:hypothetical protein